MRPPRPWSPDGEGTCIGDLVFDSTFDGGVGYSFENIGPARYRVRTRADRAAYSWRVCFRIESPGDGRSVEIEIADFNHFGQNLWQERAAVVSTDGENWTDLGVENMEIIPWAPTGCADVDDTFDDGGHPPYGVLWRVRLDAPVLWLANPTPFPLGAFERRLDALAQSCAHMEVDDLCDTPFTPRHGHVLKRVRAGHRCRGADKHRVMIIAGEHAAETAGLYACEAALEEIYRNYELLTLRGFEFLIIPAVNIDGMLLGRTYHAPDADDPGGRGINLARDWADRTRPETQAIWSEIERFRPHVFVSLHNGRHRRLPEFISQASAQVPVYLKHLRHHLPLELELRTPAHTLMSTAHEIGR